MSYPAIRRRSGGRVIGGVAGGLADHLGVDVFRVRIVFVVLTALAGAGLVAYALLWFFSPLGDDLAPPRPGERRQAWGLAIVGGMAAAVVGFAAADTPVAQLLPLVFVAVGAGLVWREFDTAPRRSDSRILTWTRLVIGAGLVVGGLVVLVSVGNRTFGGLDSTILAVVATLVGVVLLTVPVWMRLLHNLNEERSARIRNAEREEIASHLHDSVLQTLALIQKQAGNPEVVARLARSQERELRNWLFGDPAQHSGSLSAAITGVAAEVEDAYGLDVDVVTVGDLTPATDDPAELRRWTALVGAVRESLINAAKHAEVAKADVYCEVGEEKVEVFVRDRGVGFDPDEVADDRQGIAKSIRARMERAGGSVTIKSAPDRGTNVSLELPRQHHEPAAESAASREEGR